MYSQGDRLDPRKERWEKAVGGAVSGTQHIIPPRGSLAREPDYREEGMNGRSRESQYEESRPFRLRQPADHAGASATITHAAYGGMDECCDPEDDWYGSRDPWYMQSQMSRPTFDVVWGSQQSRPMTATGISAAATSDPDGDGYSGTQHHAVPLDAPNVALQDQRLMAYGERLRREEEQITQEPGRVRPTG